MKIKLLLTNEDKIKDIEITNDTDINKLFINPKLKSDILYSISFVFMHMNTIIYTFKMWEMEAFKHIDKWYKLYEGNNVKIELTPKQDVELTVKSNKGIITFSTYFSYEKILTEIKIPLKELKPVMKKYIDIHKMINKN